MMRLRLFVAAIFISTITFGQDTFYTALKDLIQEKYPALDLNGRLLAFNTWSEQDPESRELNRSYEHTASIYRVARLKGGAAGLVAVAINTGPAGPVAVAALKQDGVSFMLPIDAADLRGALPDAPLNAVYDASGKEIYSNLRSNEVFQSILNLITR